MVLPEEEPIRILDSRQTRLDQLEKYVMELIQVPTQEIRQWALDNHTNFDYYWNVVTYLWLESNIEDYCNRTWRLGAGTMKNYKEIVMARLRTEIQAKQAEFESAQPRSELLKYNAAKPQSVISKEKTFIQIFKALIDNDSEGLVDDKVLVDELVKTGKFVDEEARKYIQRFNREGQIFERSIGRWAKV